MSEPSLDENKPKTSSGMDENLAGLLCYLAGFVTGLIFLVIEKQNKFVKFHAMQSIAIFGGIFVAQYVLGFVPFFGWILLAILWPITVVLWILLMIKAYQGQKFKLPIIGDFAERQVELLK